MDLVKCPVPYLAHGSFGSPWHILEEPRALEGHVLPSEVVPRTGTGSTLRHRVGVCDDASPTLAPCCSDATAPPCAVPSLWFPCHVWCRNLTRLPSPERKIHPSCCPSWAVLPRCCHFPDAALRGTGFLLQLTLQHSLLSA